MTPPATPPTDRITCAERWSDRLNPLLIREVRQSLRSPSFSGTIIGTALISAGILICGIFAFEQNSDGQLGLGIFAILFFLLWTLGCLLLPLTTAYRFRTERGSGEFELFMITGISARQVIAGKLQATLVQVLLMLTTAAPFLMVCYLLRGISALQIALNLTALGLVTVLLVQLGIMLAVTTTSKASFSLAMLPFGLILIASYSFAVGLLNNEILDELFGSQGLVMATIFPLLIGGYHSLLFHLGAVARLESPMRNRGFPLRLLLLIAALGLPAAGLVMPDPDVRKSIFHLLFLPVATLATLLMPGPRQLVPAPIQEAWSRGWRGQSRFLFYPEQGSVLIWYALFLAILGAWEINITDSATPLLATWCVILLFWATLGNVVGRWFAPKAPVAFLSLLGFAIPSLISLFLYFANERELAMALCPISTPTFIVEVEWEPAVIPVLMASWAVILLLGCQQHLKCRRQEANEAARRSLPAGRDGSSSLPACPAGG